MLRTRTIGFLSAAVTAMVAFAGSANAAVVLTEDFEAPDVTAAAQQFPDATAGIWLSNQSFNGFRKYIVDENVVFSAGNSSGSFTTSDGDQGYTFGYNAQVGMTTKQGTLGSFDNAGSATLDFLWGRTTNETNTPSIFMSLYAFNPNTTSDANRNGKADQNPSGTQNVDWVLLQKTGFTSATSVLEAKQFAVTLGNPATDYATDVTGWDLALRIGADNFKYGVLDALQLDITLVPEPASLALLALGGVMILRRR